jgi:circadian clock protein KaiC
MRAGIVAGGKGDRIVTDKVAIRLLATGVPGLDEILGGGIPEFSFNLISGPPGSGKTTLAHQIMFALATKEKPALFFCALGESALKMLRYQQQFSFFDADKIDESVRYINLSDDISAGNFDGVLERITKEAEVHAAGLVFVDSFRSVMLETRNTPQGTIGLQQFLQQLGIHLSGWQVTTFLVGEYISDSDPHPILTVADGLSALRQSAFRNSTVRQIQILKMRGLPSRPGMQTFRISNAGMEVFPAAVIHDDVGTPRHADGPKRTIPRLAMGVPGLDSMLGGGLPSGYSLLVAGPSGSGKTILATAFLSEGIRRNEPGVIVAFEQTPSQSLTRTIDDLVRAGQLGLLNLRSLDLSIDEIVQRLLDLIQRMKAKRVVIDSLSGFELAVAPSFREDFRESLFRMVAVLAGYGVTVLMTSELEDRYTDLRFSPYGSAFLTDAIIVERYIEVESRLKRVLAVVKMRGSAHSNELRLFDITDDGIIIGEPVSGYEGLLGGSPTQTHHFEAVSGSKVR